MLLALNQAPLGAEPQTGEAESAESDDADGEITPELRMFARELGFSEPAKVLALKNFVHSCIEAGAAGAYDEGE